MRSRNQERFDLLPVNRVWGSSTTPLKNLGIVPQMKFSLDNDYHYDTIPSNFAVKGSREIRYVSNIEGQGSSVTPLKIELNMAKKFMVVKLNKTL